MKYLKVVNMPLSVLKDPKYGTPTGNSKIPFEACGFNKTVVMQNQVQYSDPATGDFLTYLPISDESKTNAVLADMQADASNLGSLVNGKTYSVEIVEDDYANWKAEAEASKVTVD